MLEDTNENESFGVSMSLSKLIVAPFLTVLVAQDQGVRLREILQFGVLDVKSVALLS
jgi:predicted amino acid racemase